MTKKELHGKTEEKFISNSCRKQVSSDFFKKALYYMWISYISSFSMLLKIVVCLTVDDVLDALKYKREIYFCPKLR